jgi:hypothetical protein
MHIATAIEPGDLTPGEEVQYSYSFVFDINVEAELVVCRFYGGNR